jgi:hypothetical protein
MQVLVLPSQIVGFISELNEPICRNLDGHVVAAPDISRARNLPHGYSVFRKNCAQATEDLRELASQGVRDENRVAFGFSDHQAIFQNNCARVTNLGFGERA